MKNITGSHPSTVDGIVNRTACMFGVNSFCDDEHDIQIKACAANEYVYYLKKTATCNAGYCFGKKEMFNFAFAVDLSRFYMI